MLVVGVGALVTVEEVEQRLAVPAKCGRRAKVAREAGQGCKWRRGDDGVRAGGAARAQAARGAAHLACHSSTSASVAVLVRPVWRWLMCIVMVRVVVLLMVVLVVVMVVCAGS